MSTSKPAIILVHGAWHSPSHFDNIATELKTAGYQVSVPALPSASHNVLQDALGDDAATIKQSIQHFTSQGTDVVVFMHSYGGFCGSEGVAAFHEDAKGSSQTDSTTAKKGRILHLVYISAMVISQGVSVAQDDLPTHIISVEDGLMHHMEPYYRFYQKTPLPIARQAIAELSPQNLSGGITPSRYCGWKDYGVPADYIICEQDRALFADPDLEKFAQRLRDAGVLRKVHRIDTDHTPWLSAQDEFMEVVREVLEQAGKGSA